LFIVDLSIFLKTKQKISIYTKITQSVFLTKQKDFTCNILIVADDRYIYKKKIIRYYEDTNRCRYISMMIMF